MVIFEEFSRVADADAVREGAVVGFEVGGFAVAIARSGGRLYAFEDVCSHQHCPLSTGLVSDDLIECEYHGAVFDMATGEAMLPPAYDPIPVFEVVEDDSGISVRIPRVAPQR